MKKTALPIFLVMLTLLSCNTTEPPPLAGNIKISEIDAAVVEAYLSIQIDKPSSDREVVIERNGQTVISFTASKTDTAITDTGLTENTVYKYKAKLTEKGTLVSESSEVSITTMSLTSHNFTWEKYTFGGGGGSSVLKDIAIIDENNIWVVGEIYIKDSIGNDEFFPYNAVHWDGSKWELKRIKYYGNCSAVEYPLLRAIWAFSANNIIITNGGSVGWFDGSNVYLDCGVNPLLNGAINKIWASSDKDIYVVGNEGSIVHYNNNWWEKIESGTNIDIQDIWGEVDNTTGKTTILAVASLQNYGRAMDLLKISNATVTKLDTAGLHINQHSMWFKSNKNFYVVGNGVYKKNSLTDPKWILEKGHPYLYKESIRGNDWNDLFVTGDFGLVSHFNGLDWRHYEIELPLSNLYSVAVKGSIVVTVGQDGDNAVIAIGKRN